jgi:translocator protein
MNAAVTPWIELVAVIGVCFIAEAIGSRFTRSSFWTWYLELERPGWAPPNWVFAPIWTLLYLSMAVAAWLVWQCGGVQNGAAAPGMWWLSSVCGGWSLVVQPSAPQWEQLGASILSQPLWLFGLQLALTVAWSAQFFGRRRPGLALLEIVVLWLAIAVTLFAFFLVSPLAGALLAPYLLWVTVVAVLNAAIWRMNR